MKCPNCAFVFTPEKQSIEKKKTDLQRVVEAYKHAKGIPMEDKAWDKACFARCSKSGKALLERFGGDLEKSAAYIFLRGAQLDEIGCDWTIETILKHAWDGLGIPKPKEEGDGFKRGKVESNSLPDARGHRRLASGREVARETLRAIESTAIRAEGAARLEADRGNSPLDDEPFE